MKFISKKQLNYIVYLLKSEMPLLMARLPKNNDRYTDPFGDYSICILEDKLKYLPFNYANTLIDLIHSGEEAQTERFIFGLNGIK